MYTLQYTDTALEDLKWFKKHEQKEILDSIHKQLRYVPNVETRSRKRLRPNSVATWELRVGEFRVFYDVETTVRIVDIIRIGEKRGNLLYFRGHKEDL